VLLLTVAGTGLVFSVEEGRGVSQQRTHELSIVLAQAEQVFLFRSLIEEAYSIKIN
jgi:hypothetical protein